MLEKFRNFYVQWMASAMDYAVLTDQRNLETNIKRKE